MTTLDEVMTNYKLHDELIINECIDLGKDKFNILFDDVLFQITIYAEHVDEAYIIWKDNRVQVDAKMTGFGTWTVCVKMPTIAIGVFCFCKYTYLDLPGAKDVHRVVSLSRYFFSEHRKFLKEDFLPACGYILFDINGKNYAIRDS